MEFPGKSMVLNGQDLEQLLTISPSEEGLRQARRGVQADVRERRGSSSVGGRPTFEPWRAP
jgi:hypothetical protein